MQEYNQLMFPRSCSYILKSLGWTIETDYPGVDKYVLVAAPHTSNWDFPLGLAGSWALDLDALWIGKHTLFRKPYGWFFRALGGTPVDRRQATDLIQQMTDLFNRSEKMILALAPEGTRSETDHWKSGFYYIARAAGVPIAMAYLDYGKKQLGIGGGFYPSEDIQDAFRRIREFYRDRKGKYPEKASLIQPRQR